MNLIIAQSGGPTSVINSSLAGAIEAAIDNDFNHIYLSNNGIEGILKEHIDEVDQEIFAKDNCGKKLMARPSSILGSCRYKLSDDLDHPDYGKIFEVLKKNAIDLFIYIGGNDSMDTVSKLNKYMADKKIEDIHVIGCPKTIDNDLMGMDHSPGYGSAAKYISSTIRTIRTDVDIYDLESVTFVEIMGRHAGWLAASSLVANHKAKKDQVNLLYIPEDEKYLDDIFDDIKEALKTESNLIVALAEGFRDLEDKLSEEVFSNSKDGFNHPVVAGVGERLATMVRERLEVKSRAIELNTVQRTNTLISKTDAEEAYKLGYRATELGIDHTNLVPVLKRENKDTYQVTYTEVKPSEIANREMMIPVDWLGDKKILEEKMINYCLPLIQGEIAQTYQDGMPVFIEKENFIK
ncbi:diphosphate--fructose-6-phosphate 1-phosphotransferase [uncultured Anaerococcus sp.]|uniref:diphosphate--fructose-6-phosphate 1-phosphotransferase n=1 Tax=uncultured Anaerococcus sp. TaxID=293428 RepID=UPI002889E0F7|nr:diphosphate--fructose-6-phosphate 1-phosphotransferase [uncultured Anaerococcus sp.]